MQTPKEFGRNATAGRALEIRRMSTSNGQHVELVRDEHQAARVELRAPDLEPPLEIPPIQLWTT